MHTNNPPTIRGGKAKGRRDTMYKTRVVGQSDTASAPMGFF
jgi:hypothetical protein